MARYWSVSGLLLVATLMLAVTACDDAGTETSGPEISTLTAGTVEAGTARLEGTSTLTPDEGKSSLEILEGRVDFEAARSSFETRFEVADRTLVVRSRSIDGYAYTSPASATSTPPDVGLQAVLDTQGKSWVRRPDEPSSEFDLLGTPDVSGFVSALQRAGARTEHVGTDEVRGVRTEHFRLTFDRRTPPLQVERMNLMGAGIQTYDVWTDSRHRLRRFAQSFDGERHRWESRIELFDFGSPITIEVPPADEVVIDDRNVLTGNWKLAREGRADGDEWRVYRAPTTTGTCLSHETDPPSPQLGGAYQRGRLTELCVIDPVELFEDAPPMIVTDLTAKAVELPNGMALIYGTVATEAEHLTLHFADGDREQLDPHDETFAVALPADELVNKIVLEGAKRKVSCRLEKRYGFLCSGTLAPPERWSPEGPPSPPGVIDTTPPLTPPSP